MKHIQRYMYFRSEQRKRKKKHIPKYLHLALLALEKLQGLLEGALLLLLLGCCCSCCPCCPCCPCSCCRCSCSCSVVVVVVVREVVVVVGLRGKLNENVEFSCELLSKYLSALPIALF